MDQLYEWADRVMREMGIHAPPRWFMSWLCASDVDSRVDFFDVGEPLLLDDDRRDLLRLQEVRSADAVVARSAASQVPVVSIAGQTCHLVSQRVGAVRAGRVEWLHLAVSETAWPVLLVGPSGPRHDGSDIVDRPLSEDFDVAHSSRWASVLTVEAPSEAPRTETVVALIEEHIGG